MPITLITGPANAGKTGVVMDTVRGHLVDGQAPLLVVPTFAEADRCRRELAGEGAAMGARVERFEGLIGEAVRRAGVKEPTLGRVARERVLAVLAGHRESGEATDREGAGSPGPKPASEGARAASASAPGFVRALARFLAELQVRRVTPARLSGALTEWAAAEGSEAAGGQVGRLFADYQRTLREIGRLDEDQRAVRALDRLRRNPALWEGTPVLFCGFGEFTRLALDAIETLGTVVGASVTVSLSYEPGRIAFAGPASTFQALLPLTAEHRELAARPEHYAAGARAALSHVERSLFEPDVRRADPGGAVRLLEGGGERAELELVAREIGALLEQGTAAEEIAVVLPAPGAAAELLEEVFGSAQIPHALQRRRPFADTAVGRALIGLLRSVPGGGGGTEGGDAGDLLAWLRAPGLLERPELADRLEARARRAGAASAAQARALWEERHWRLEAIDHLQQAAARGGEALFERAERELEWLFCAPRRGRAGVLGDDELDDSRALAAGRRALAELRELARLRPGLAPGEAAELASVLERLELQSGEHPMPGAVAVLDARALAAADGGGRVRALFACGLQEGAFPAPARPEPFLAGEERRRLAETSGLRLGEQVDALDAERYLFYAAVSRPQELLVLSWHTAGDDGASAARSLFVDDVCDLFDDGLRERCVRRPLGAVGWPPSGDLQARRARAGGVESLGDRSGVPASLADVAGGLTLRDRAGGLAPLVEEKLLERLRERPWSASSLETWISCPVRWLVERLLRADDLDPEPEPFARGGLAHAALKDTLEGLKRETGSARLTPAKLGLAHELLERALRENETRFVLAAAPERRPVVARRLKADLERYLEHAAATAFAPVDADSTLEPRHLELAFGLAEEPQGGLPAFDLGGGVMLRGRIDRVDLDGRGAAVVYDYKGRSASPAARWIADGSLQVALYMRAVEHLLGVRAVGGFYQPLSGRDLRARGVYDKDEGLQIECVGADARERADLEALLDWATAAAREAAAQAGRGEVEARPDTCAFRGGCAYPTICRCERR